MVLGTEPFLTLYKAIVLFCALVSVFTIEMQQWVNTISHIAFVCIAIFCHIAIYALHKTCTQCQLTRATLL